MDVGCFLRVIQRHELYGQQVSHVEELPARAGDFAAPREPFEAEVVRLLQACGIEQLYSHQVSALETARAGHDLVVVTGTASGKTLCYNLPILACQLLARQNWPVSTTAAPGPSPPHKCRFGFL